MRWSLILGGVLAGLALVAAVILVTFLVDLGYALIDPRLRK